MEKYFYTAAFIVLICARSCSCYQIVYNGSIFIHAHIKDYCDMDCGSQKHWLCDYPGGPGSECADNFKYEVNTNDDIDTFLLGINGLRHRIAEKMHVSNMIKLTWDPELELLARVYLESCKLFEEDPCTHIGGEDRNNAHKEPRYWHVAINKGFHPSLFPLDHFITSTMRDWYYGKNYLKKPLINTTQYEEQYGELIGHNNFTRLANPVLSRVGCGHARIFGGFAFICYFFPSFASNVAFQYGPPATDCPNLFPLRSLYLNNLCTNRGVRLGNLKNAMLVCVLVNLL